MPEVPSALPAPKSLGGLLNHIDGEEETEETGFSALSERAEEISEDIEERQQIVSELLAQDDEIEEEPEAEQEV